jgi:protein translocase SecG subunit
MFGAIIVVICIIAVLLVFVVLIQNPKGGGLSGEFGTAGASQMFGVQRTGDLLEQITWGGAITIALLVLALLLNLVAVLNQLISKLQKEKRVFLRQQRQHRTQLPQHQIQPHLQHQHLRRNNFSF